MFIDWIIPLFGWTFLVGGCLTGILGAVSFQDPRAVVNPLRRAMLPMQNWIPVVLACVMIGFGALFLLDPSLTTILALKPYLGAGMGIAGVALVVAAPPYIRRLWALVPRDASRGWRRWLLIALGTMVEGASLMGIGGGAVLLMPEPFGPAFRAVTTVVSGLGILVSMLGIMCGFAAGTYRFFEQFEA